MTSDRGIPKDLLVSDERAAELRRSAVRWPSLDLSAAQCADVELLLSGALDPLAGFMTRREIDQVEATGRLPEGTVWPVSVRPVLSGGGTPPCAVGQTVALRDAEGVMLAALHVTDLWEAEGRWHAGGRLEGVSLPAHYDFRALRLTPQAVRVELARRGWSRVLGVYPGAVLHRGQLEAVRSLAEDLSCAVLLHVPVGDADTGVREHYDRVSAMQVAAGLLGADQALVALVPIPRDRATDRPDALRVMVARNFGCTHVLPRLGSEPRWEHESLPDDIEVVTLPEATRQVSAEEIVDLLRTGRPVPESLLLPQQVQALEHSYPRRGRQGVALFFTGLSGSGKSTIANAIKVRLLERTGRQVTLLDGDLVRKHLSSELGFSREHRDLNILRIGFVAAEIVKHGGLVICAPIAPYDAIRRRVAAMVEAHGGFVLIHVSTPLEECERRDRKGLYAKARAGLIEQFTGISDVYETPANASVTIDTTVTSVDEAVDDVLGYLVKAGYLEPSGLVDTRPAS